VDQNLKNNKKQMGNQENKLPIDIISMVIENYFTKNYNTAISAEMSLPVYDVHGDLTTNIALRSSKIIGEKPIDIANKLVEFLQTEIAYLVDKIEIAGPGLINIFLSNTARKNIITNTLNTTNDFKINTDTGLHWVIEHTSPNPNKAMHLGHLRNNLVGMSLANMIENCGAVVTRDAVDNNRGIAIAKAMYGFLALERKNTETEVTIKAWTENKNSWYTPEEKDTRPDVFVTNCYTGGEELRKNDPTGEIDKAIRQMVLDWEEKDADTWALWQHILDYSYTGMNITLARLGNKWDKVWHEHEHYQSGKDYVEAGLAKGIFKKLDDGAVLTQIEEKYNIPETILLKNDGTALYITQDIALTDLKKKTYNADKLVWVIGPEQSLAMQQLFCVCEQLGIGKLSDFFHIAYGYMGLKDDAGNFKKMSSRSGTVLLIDDLIDTVKERIVVNKNELVEDDELVEKLAMAAIRFSILKCEKNMNMAFDINESVNINGDSGIYVLYTLARIKSILRTANFESKNISAEFSGAVAQDVLRKINAYSVVLHSARKHLSVHPIAHYLLELASTFNNFYNREKVLDGGKDEQEKLAILNSVLHVMEHGLGILGIETVEKM